MAKHEEKATIHRCDGCGESYIQLEGDDLPNGYHGHVTIITTSGGRGGEYFACKKRCLAKAIDQAGEDQDVY